MWGIWELTTPYGTHMNEDLDVIIDEEMELRRLREGERHV